MAIGQPGGFGCQSLAHQVSEYLLDNHGVFNAGDHYDAAATFSARLDIGVEDALEALRPGHGCATFDRHLLLRLTGRFGLVAFAPPSRCHQRTVFAVRGKHAIISSLSCFLVILITTGR